MNKIKVAIVLFTVVAIIGLLSVINHTRNVNMGAFIFPEVIALILFRQYYKKNK